MWAASTSCSPEWPASVPWLASRVREKRGDYHDALYNKRNTVVLFMVSLFGGLSAQALRYMTTLRTRAKTRRRDTTDYVRVQRTECGGTGEVSTNGRVHEGGRRSRAQV